MSSKMYLCDQCNFRFLQEEEQSCCETSQGCGCSTNESGVKCPRCGNTQVKMLPFDPRMLLDMVALFRNGFRVAPQGG